MKDLRDANVSLPLLSKKQKAKATFSGKITENLALNRESCVSRKLRQQKIA